MEEFFVSFGSIKRRSVSRWKNSLQGDAGIEGEKLDMPFGGQAKEFHLIFGLHAFGNYPESEIVRRTRQRSTKRGSLFSFQN